MNEKKINSLLLSKKFKQLYEQTLLKTLLQQSPSEMKIQALGFLRGDFFSLYLKPDLLLERNGYSLQNLTGKKIGICIDPVDLSQAFHLLNSPLLKNSSLTLISQPKLPLTPDWPYCQISGVKALDLDWIWIYSHLSQELYTLMLTQDGIPDKKIKPLLTLEALLADGYMESLSAPFSHFAILCYQANEEILPLVLKIREKFPVHRISLFCMSCQPYHYIDSIVNDIYFYNSFIELLFRLLQIQAKAFFCVDEIEKHRDLLEECRRLYYSDSSFQDKFYANYTPF